MASTTEDSRDGRLMGLALAKGWIRKEHVRLGSLAALLEGGMLEHAQVEALSQELDRGQALLGQRPKEDEAPTSLNWPASAQPPSSASLFTATWVKSWAHFEDLVLIGEGGMGRIFKAMDTRLSRRVAVKLLRRDDSELGRRLVKEAELQARVNHPNVCRIYEAGQWNGQAFITMEHVEGTTFKGRAQTWTLGQKLALMIQICEGVHAAHREGLIHRDLKPGNLMATIEDNNLRAVVLDFGLARPAEEAGLTISGMLVGTVHYMSPEQARGQHRALDCRTDIYALGITLYELLKGRTPFHDSTGLDAIGRILSENPPPLTGTPEVSPDLNRIVMKCLEKEPIHRYATARALGDDLRRVLEGEPILARAVPLRERALYWMRKNFKLTAVASAALVAITALSILGIRERVRAGRRAELAQRFGQEAERVEALARYLRLQPARDLTPDWDQVKARAERLYAEVARVGPEGEAPGAYALGRVALALDRPDEARRHLERAWSLGFRTPAASLALGQAIAAQYEHELAKAGTIPDPAVRKAELERAARDYGRPAAEHLRNGASASVEPGAFHAAWLALLEGRLDQAIDRSRAALERSPWHFEALRIEAQAWIQKARLAPTEDQSQACLEQASRALGTARAIARADRSLILLQLQRWQEAVAIGWRTAANPRPAIEAQAALTKELRILEPQEAASWAWEGRAFGEQARYLAFDGRDPNPWLLRARYAAEQAYGRAPNDPDACAAVVSVLRTEGFLAMTRGKGDPEPLLQEGLRIAQVGLKADPGSLFLFNLRTACYAVLLDHHKTMPRFDFSSEQPLLEEYRAAARAHPDLAYYQGALGTVLLGLAGVREALGLDYRAYAIEAKEASIQALKSEPRHLGVFRGILLACAAEARALTKEGTNPASVVDEARAVLAQARMAGLSHKELEVPVALVELASAEHQIHRENIIKAKLFYREAIKRLKEVKTFPTEPDLLLRARLRGEILGAELAPRNERGIQAERIIPKLEVFLLRHPEDPEVKALGQRLSALRA